ncbi:BCCT family transporter [Pseudoalteromonas espejiana]
MLIFVATSADSAILVIKELSSSNKNMHTNNTVSLYGWSFALGLCAFVLLVQNNEPLNRSVAIIGALPFLVIFILQLLGFIKEFISEFKH